MLYAFSYPIAAQFFSLYIKEENLIGNISAYLAEMSRWFNKDSDPQDCFPAWDDSHLYRERLLVSLRYSLVAAFLSFIIFPAILVVSFTATEGLDGKFVKGTLAFSTICGIVMTIWLWREYQNRKPKN